MGEATDGRQALRAFRQHPRKIDLVLTDFLMPLMDGGELAERIRDIDPKVPIVLVSAPVIGEAAELSTACNMVDRSACGPRQPLQLHVRRVRPDEHSNDPLPHLRPHCLAVSHGRGGAQCHPAHHILLLPGGLPR